MQTFSYDCTSHLLQFYKFTGKERDQESGTDYFGARYYGSSMSRFLSPDYNKTEDDPEPVPYPDVENRQSLNLYGYAGNNPLSMTGPDGHCPNALQGLCDFFTELKNKLVHGEFTTDTAGATIRQLDRQEARDRQTQQMYEQMQSHPP